MLDKVIKELETDDEFICYRYYRGGAFGGKSIVEIKKSLAEKLFDILERIFNN